MWWLIKRLFKLDLFFTGFRYFFMAKSGFRSLTKCKKGSENPDLKMPQGDALLLTSIVLFLLIVFTNGEDEEKWKSFIDRPALKRYLFILNIFFICNLSFFSPFKLSWRCTKEENTRDEFWRCQYSSEWQTKWSRDWKCENDRKNRNCGYFNNNQNTFIGKWKCIWFDLCTKLNWKFFL